MPNQTVSSVFNPYPNRGPMVQQWDMINPLAYGTGAGQQFFMRVPGDLGHVGLRIPNVMQVPRGVTRMRHPNVTHIPFIETGRFRPVRMS